MIEFFNRFNHLFLVSKRLLEIIFDDFIILGSILFENKFFKSFFLLVNFDLFY